MKKTVIGSYEEGQIALESYGDRTLITVHWPADRMLDEWMDVSLELPADASRKIAEFDKELSVGSPGNELFARVRAGGTTLLRCTGRNTLGPIQAEMLIDEDKMSLFTEHFAKASRD